MKLMITILSFFSFVNLHSQSFSVQQNNIYLSGISSDNDFYQNTYLDGLSNTTLYWSIITDSMPSNWDFSNCFPNCYSIGVTSGTLNISNGQSYYLNCHFYPNNTSGEGFVSMEITDSISSEIVTWYGVAGNVGLEENYIFNKKDIKNIYNLNGQIVRETEPNQLYIIQLKNDTFIKVFIHE